MTDLELNTRKARFLQEAAHLLAVSSPAAASFLGSARHELITGADANVPTKEYDAICREACSACGNVLIPGWSCKVSTRSSSQLQSAKGKKSDKSHRKLESRSVYECLRCHRETIQTLQPKPPRQTKKAAKDVASNPATKSSEPVTEANDKISKTVNASSKQRQKARRGGLQAMLEKKKSQNSNTGGFDLMDFAI